MTSCTEEPSLAAAAEQIPSMAKPQFRWVPAQDGLVPAGAIVAGRERNNPHTFIGRCSLGGAGGGGAGQKHLGRIVPSDRGCYAVYTGMEHRRSCYEVLVNASSAAFRLVWRKDFGGHVPDTAVALRDSSPQTVCYVGRAAVEEGALVPGCIVPEHGAIHCGYDNRELVMADYEVLCLSTPCSLKYLAAKRVRDQVREWERIKNAKYITKISNIFFSLEKMILSLLKKEHRRRDSVEDKLELPLTLSRYLRSPKLPKLLVTPRLDFNTILANCCPPEDNCTCQIWVEVSLQGLY